jgi:hypothetical protein
LKVLTICYKQYQTDDMAMQKGFVCTSRGDSPMRGCFTPHRRRALPVRGGQPLRGSNRKGTQVWV